MRLHEAVPRLIIQERVGDKVKVSSYWPVPELTRAGVALGQLHHAPRQNGHPHPWWALRSWRIRSILMRFCSARAPVCPNHRWRTCRSALAASNLPLLRPRSRRAVWSSWSRRSIWLQSDWHCSSIARYQSISATNPQLWTASLSNSWWSVALVVPLPPRAEINHTGNAPAG